MQRSHFKLKISAKIRYFESRTTSIPPALAYVCLIKICFNSMGILESYLTYPNLTIYKTYKIEQFFSDHKNKGGIVKIMMTKIYEITKPYHIIIYVACSMTDRQTDQVNYMPYAHLYREPSQKISAVYIPQQMCKLNFPNFISYSQIDILNYREASILKFRSRWQN